MIGGFDSVSNKMPEPRAETEFDRIINQFDIKLNKLDELSRLIAEKTSVIITFEESAIKETNESKSSGALIGEFELRLARLQDVNDRLDNVLYNLIRLVG